MARDYDTTTNEYNTGTASKDYDNSSRKRRVLSASTLAGDRVRNSAGEDLGKIEELMIDVTAGRVAYAVLSFGGFLGMGSKLFAVPWDALTIDEENHEFFMNVDKQTLENAPGFDKDNWPDMADTSWGAQVYDFYGKRPYWDATGQTGDFNRGTERISPSGRREKTRTGGGSGI
ncbi:MAG: PRC-barrel domain-containing protein [Bryobacteraceae bacterium]